MDTVSEILRGSDLFILPSQTGTAIPLRRLNFCPSQPCPSAPIHHWTIDQNEFDVLTSGGAWLPEGIAGYVYSPAGPAPASDPGEPAEEPLADGPAIRAVVHGAYAQAAPFAAGQLVRIWGRRFPPAAEVRFDGGLAQVVSATEWEIQAIVPAQVAGRPESRVTVAGVAHEISIAPSAPGIAVTDEYGKGLLPGYEHAWAERGKPVTVRFTGLGSSGAPVVIRIGGVRADIEEIGVAAGAPGYFDARVRVPENPIVRDGLARVSISIGESFSQTGVLIPIVQ